jgi:hypothetical protein
MVTIICATPAGAKVPLDGLKVIPLPPLLDAVQASVPWLFGSLVSISLHVQFPLLSVLQPDRLNFVGPTLKLEPEHPHDTFTVFAGPVKLKVPVAGQVWFGLIPTCTD